MNSPRSAAALLPFLVGLSLLMPLTGCHTWQRLTAVDEGEQRASLRAELAPHLNVLGARNWIVIADPTHPILAGEGVDVVSLEADTPDTLREVLRQLEADGALTPRIWTCSELENIPEHRAPGVQRYRKKLSQLTRRHLVYEMTERIISMQLRQAAQTYRILYLKTTTPLPYSSVAIELDSGYWDSSAETELRTRMEQQPAPAPQS